MEDGHTLFDYDVRLNDIIQLLVRQSLVLPPSHKDRDPELSDTDSGCCLGQSESDKSSTHGEAAPGPEGGDAWDETELGLYKVRLLATGVAPACPPLGPPFSAGLLMLLQATMVLGIPW